MNRAFWVLFLGLFISAVPACNSNGDDESQPDVSTPEDVITGLCSAAFPCQDDWIGDGSCDAPCNCEVHDFDGGDCDPDVPEDVVSTDEGSVTDEGSTPDEGTATDEGSASDEGSATDEGNTVDEGFTVVEDSISGDTGPAPQGPIEIAGTWENNFGSIDNITSETWDFGMYVDSIIYYENDENSMLTMTPDTVEWSLIDTYNVIHWTDITQNANGKDTFYYCTVVYGKASAEEAATATPVYDNSAEDPFDWTCGDFGSPWTTAIRMGDAP